MRITQSGLVSEYYRFEMRDGFAAVLPTYDLQRDGKIKTDRAKFREYINNLPKNRKRKK